MTDEPTPDLSETLEQIAEQAKPVDLSQAVARKVRSLRRRRNAAGAAAAVLALAIVGGGGYALTRTTGSSSYNAGAGAPVSSSAPASATVLPALTTYVTPSAVLPAAPSPGIITSSPGITPPAPLTTLPRSTPSALLKPPPLAVSSTPRAPTMPTTSPSSSPLPCTVIDDFGPGAAGTLVVTDAMKAKARAMGDRLCELVGGGARYDIEEWISIGGLSMGFNGLTYDVQAHLSGAGAGPVSNEAWLAVYKAPAGTTPTFKDGTVVTLQTELATSLKAQIEVEGGPFDAFAAG